MAAVFATGTAVMDAAPVATAGAAATAGIYAAVASVNTAAALVVTAAAAAGVTVTASAAASAVTAENMAVCPALTVSALAAEKAQETHTAASHPIFPCKQRPRLPQSQTNETLQQQSQQKTQQQQQQHFRTPQCTPVLPCVSLRWPRSSHELELLADLQSPNVAPPPQPLLQQQAQQHKRRAHSNQEQGHRQQTKHKRQKSPDSCEAAGEASPTARRVGHSAVTSMLSDGKQLQLSLTGVVFYSGSESSALRAAADIAARTSLPEATLLHQQLEQAGLTADAAPGEQTCRATVQRPGQRPQAQQRGRHEQQGATRTQHSQEYLAQLRPPRMLLQEDGRHQQGGQPQDRRWQQPLNLQTAPPHREALKQMARWWSSAACCGAWGPGVWGATCELLSRPPRRWERSSSSCSGSSTSQSTRSPVVRSSTSAASTCETHTRGTSAADETTSTPTRGAAAAGLASATAGPPPYTATRTWRHRVVPAWAGAISHPVRFPSYPPPRWRIQNLPSNDNVRRSSNSQSERTGGSALAHRSGDVCGCQGEPVVPESVGDSGSSWRSAARRWESISSTKKNATASQSSCLSSRYPLRPRDVYDQAHLHTRSVIMALGEGSWSSSHAGGVVRMQEARSTGDAVDEGDLQQTKSGSSSSWPELDRCGESWRMTQQQKGAALDRLLKAFRFRRLKRQGPGFESWGVNKEAAARSVDSGRPRARRVVAVVARVLVLLAVLLWEDAGSTRRRDTPPAAADAPAGRAATAGTAASRGGRDILRVACRAEMTGFGASGAVSYAPLTNNCRETALHSRTASDPGLHMCRGRQQQQLPVPADFRHARGRKAKCADEGYDWLVSCTSSSSPSIRSHLWRGEPEQAGHHVRNGLNGREVRSDSGVSSSTRRKRSHGNGNFIGDRRTDYSSNSCSKSMPSIRRATVASGLVFASAEPVAAAASPSEQGSNPAAEAGAAPTATTEWEDTFVTAMMLVEKEDNHEAAFPLFADCSMSDDVRCQYELGVYYFLGLPPLPARNFTAAMLLWHVSAWGGSAEAQYALSLMHANLRDLPVLPAFPPQTWGAGAAVAAAGSPPAARASTTAKSAAAAEREPAECAAAEGKIEAAAGGAASKMRPLQEKEGPRLWPLVQVRESDFAVLLLDREGTTDWAPLTSFTEQLQQQAYDEQQQIRFFRWLRSSSLFRAFGRLRETLSGWWDPLFGSSSNGSNRTVSTNTGRRTTDKARKKARKQKRHPKKPSGGKNDEVVMNSTMRAAVDAGLAGAPSPRPSGAAAAGSSPSPSSRQQRKRSAASAARRTAAAESTSSAAPARVSSVPNFASSSGVPMVLLYAAAAAGHPGAMMAMAQRLQSSSLDAPLRQQQACTGATNFLLPLARQVATTYASGIPQAPELLRFHSPMMSVNSKGQQHNDALLLFVPQPTAGAASADWFGSRSGGAGSNGGTSAGGNGDSTPSGLVDRLSPSSRELDMLTAVAQEGNTAVQLALGKRYLFGVEGLPQDFRLAQEFLLAAAEGGRSEARALLGYMYSLGVGVPRNTTSATFWFLSAVEAADHPVAYSGLGYLHFFGTDLIERNEEVALHFFNVSATHGFPDAQTNLASMYISGHGHSQSFVQAMQWYTRALQSGSTGAAYALGLMHLNGLGAVRDCALASSLLKRLVERSGYVTIKLQRVYDLYAQGRYDEAAFLLLLLAEAGLEVAQSDLAYLFDSGLTDLFFDGTIEKQRVHAQRYYEMATHQGSPLAGLRLGDFAYHGYGMQRLILPNRRQGCRYVDDEGNDMTEWVKEAIPVYTPRKVNYSAAVAHYRKVAEMSTSHKWMAAYAARGSFNLGFMHMYGLGVKQDFALARLYFGKCLEADPSSPRAPVYVALALLLLLRYKHEADIQRVVKQLYADVRVSLLVVLLLLLVVLLVIRRLTQILLQQVALNEAFEQLQMTRLQEQRQRQQQQRQQQPQQSQPQQSQPQQSQPQQSQPQQSQPRQPQPQQSQPQQPQPQQSQPQQSQPQQSQPQQSQPQQSQPQQSQPQQSQPQQSQPQQSQPQQLQTQQSQTQESQPQQSQPQQPQQQQDREEE